MHNVYENEKLVRQPLSIYKLLTIIRTIFFLYRINFIYVNCFIAEINGDEFSLSDQRGYRNRKSEKHEACAKFSWPCATAFSSDQVGKGGGVNKSRCLYACSERPFR